MSGVAWPLVKDRLVALIPTLTPAPEAVYDGDALSGDAPASYCTVGWQPSTDEETAGTFDQTVGPDGFSAHEDGAVLLEYAAVTGDTDMPDAFSMVAALQRAVQLDPTLGVLVRGVTATTVSANIVDAQTTAGAVQRVLVTVGYSTDVP